MSMALGLFDKSGIHRMRRGLRESRPLVLVTSVVTVAALNQVPCWVEWSDSRERIRFSCLPRQREALAQNTCINRHKYDPAI